MNHYHENTEGFSSLFSLNTSVSCIPRTCSHCIYNGKRDQYGLREEGFIRKITDESWEIYEGKFTFDNQHGNGIYKWITDKGKTVYEGYIYCNNIHGYGRFSYPDGSVYEGLYKNNGRYGPGIHTEPNGKQNVGLWRNQRLIKLAVKVETDVPSLTRTKQGLIRALRYRKIVPITQISKDKAKDILTEMNAPPHIMEASGKLYNVLVKDNRSQLFNWQPYEETFYRKPIEKSKSVHKTESKREIKQKFGRFKKKRFVQNRWKNLLNDLKRKISIDLKSATHLIAWNNSPIMEEMLLFCFKHTDQESIITYNITNVIKGKRYHFRAPGTHETLCVRFLQKCQEGDHWRVNDYLAFKRIDPNIADSDGNTGLITAVANDRLAVIDVILDRGADINLCNDQGFTPLALCVTRYLVLMYDVNDWEEAFLNKSVELNYPDCVLKWRHKDHAKDRDEYSNVDDKVAALDVEPGTRDEDIAAARTEEFLDKIAVVKETILKLLQRGADPILCDVPMPVLIMAVQCEDEEIIRLLMEARSNHKASIQDDQSLEDALFTAVQLPLNEKMVSICTLLLKYGADPNAKIQSTGGDEEIFNVNQPTEDELAMKTFLHAVVTRKDGQNYNEHLCAVVKLLINHHADPNAVFLGHTPLSAAIVTGNTGVIECLMATQRTDPNQKLTEELGVPLTVLLSHKCFQRLPAGDAIRIVNILVNNGASLLTDIQVGNFTGNVVEFALVEFDDLKCHLRQGKREASHCVQEYKSLVDYITKLAKEGLINEIKEIICRSSQAFTSLTTSTICKKRSPRFTSRHISKDETVSIKIRTEMQGLPEWLNADDIVQILNVIQLHENFAVTKEGASVVLTMVMSTRENAVDQRELDQRLSLVLGRIGSEEIYTKKQSETNAEMKTQENKLSWDLLAALRRRKSLRETKAYDSIRNTNYESDKD